MDQYSDSGYGSFFDSENISETNKDFEIGQNAQICPEQLATLMKDKVKPKVQLNMCDLYEEKINQEILQIFKCIFCHGIPINPHECVKCEVVFCFECKKMNDRVADYRASRKCPQCRESFQMKKINKNLNALTIEKLKFQHVCCTEQEQAELNQAKEQKELTPFERFKLTPEYRQILIRNGKLQAGSKEDSEKNNAQQSQTGGEQAQANNINSSEQQIAEKAVDKKKTEMKIMSYKEYLKHLREDNCAKYKIYTCPLNCEPNSNTKMSYKEYVHHIKSRCPNVLIQCIRCNEKTQRKFYRKHQTRTCISNLSKSIQKQKQQTRLLKKKRTQCLKTYLEKKTILDAVRD